MKKRVLGLLLCFIFCVVSLSQNRVLAVGETNEVSSTVSEEKKGTFADSPSIGQLRVNCGATGFMQETYLKTAGASYEKELVITYNSNYGKDNRSYMSRTLGGQGSFSYEIPVADLTSDPNYLSLATYGKMAVKVNGTVIYNGLDANNNVYTPREFPIGNLVNSDTLTIEFSYAATSGEAGVLWFEVGASSIWQDRMKHILWDTKDVTWQVGYYDGSDNEFNKTASQVTAGGDFSSLRSTGTVIINWEQGSINSNSKYYLLTGCIGSGTTSIDVGNDGSTELSRNGVKEKIYDLDITEQIQTGPNRVKINIGGRLDFVTLVEVEDGFTQDEELRVVFKGNQLARDWSRLINNTMYWHNDYMVEESTGFIDASLMNGIFVNQYWVADAAPATIEMSKWGYYDESKQTTNYYNGNEVGNYWGLPGSRIGDNGAAGIMFSAMVQMMKTENFSGEYTAKMYSNLQQGMNYYCSEMDKSGGLDLIKGNNYETTNKDYGIYNNGITYFALLNGALAARETGNTSDATKWTNYASRLKQAITDELILDQNKTWLGQPIPEGTFRYAISSSGVDSTKDTRCHAGWFAIGSQEDLFYGYEGDAVEEWREAVNKMLVYHSETFWNDWALYGHNRGFGTDYGVLSERGGWPFSAMLMSDQMAMSKANLEHLIYNSVDVNFANDNEGVQETSPWVLVREVSKHDTGVTGADIGNGGASEDMNLVEYAVTLKNARIMAGVDDALVERNNLKIIPRIPREWTGVEVHNWPTLYRDGSDYAQTKISYDYTLAPNLGKMILTSEKPIEDVQVRFGPFELGATVDSATVDGNIVAVTSKKVGDSLWAYVTADVDNQTEIKVNVTVPGLTIYDNFDDGDLAGWNLVNGNGVVEEGRVKVSTTSGKASLVSTEPKTTTNNMIYSADVQLDRNGEAGIFIGANEVGQGGYALTIRDNFSDTSYGNLIMTNHTTGEQLFNYPLNVNKGRPYNLKVSYVDGAIIAYHNGLKVGVAFVNVEEGHFGVTTTSNAKFDHINMNNGATEAMGIDVSNLVASVSGQQQATVLVNTPIQIQVKGQLADGSQVNLSSSVVKVTTADGQSTDNAIVVGNQVTFKGAGSYKVRAEIQVKGQLKQSNELLLTVKQLNTGAVIADFESGQLFKGTTYGGDWSVENGQAKVVTGSYKDAWYFSNKKSKDMTYSGELMIQSGNAVGLSFRNTGSVNTGYDVILDVVDGGIKLCKRPYQVIQRVSFPVERNKIYQVSVVVKGNQFEVYLDGVKVITATDATYPAEGYYGMFAYSATALLDNLALLEDLGFNNQTSLSLTLEGSAMLVGDEKALALKGIFSDGTEKDLMNLLDTYNIQFVSSDSDVAVIEDGKIISKAYGQSQIHAFMDLEDGTRIKSNVVTILVVDPTEFEVNLPKEHLQLTESMEVGIMAALPDGTTVELSQFPQLQGQIQALEEGYVQVQGRTVRATSRGVFYLKAVVTLPDGSSVNTATEKLTIYTEDDILAEPIFKNGFDNSDDLTGWSQVTGNWQVANGVLTATGANDMWILNTGVGKYADVVYEGDITYDTYGAGITIRANEVSSGITAYDVGLDFYAGIQLSRRNPGWQRVALNTTFKPVKGQSYHLKVVARGNRIKAYVDDTLYIDYTETNDNPYTEGYFGGFIYQSGTNDNLEAYSLVPSDVLYYVTLDQMTPSVGDVVTATVAPLSEGILYQWMVDGIATGEMSTQSSYQVKEEDRGKKISVRITKLGENKGTASSEETETVQ